MRPKSNLILWSLEDTVCETVLRLDRWAMNRSNPIGPRDPIRTSYVSVPGQEGDVRLGDEHRHAYTRQDKETQYYITYIENLYCSLRV